MKLSEECGIAASKRKQIIGLVMRDIVYTENEQIILMYETMVRRHLELL